MGTRGLTAVIKDGDFKIAQYGQWDHYPSGQGQIVLDFFKKDGALEALTAALDKARWITDEEYREGTIRAGVDPEKEWITMAESKAINREMPFLSRDHGAAILEAVTFSEELYGTSEVLLRDEREFGADSLYCEWAYVVDLDEGVLIVCKGFQTEPHSEGPFATLPPTEGYRDAYFPVRPLFQFPLNDLPDYFSSEYDEESDVSYVVASWDEVDKPDVRVVL